MDINKSTYSSNTGESLNGSPVESNSKMQTNGATAESLDNKNELEDSSLFLDNAFLFLRNTEQILADSRLFLAPVPIKNSLAYSGLKNYPVLGVYLEWWMALKEEVVRNTEGGQLLICQFVGNLMTGSNSCLAVRPDGSTESVTSLHFRTLWKTFRDIDKRYVLTRQPSHAFTLAEVVDILKAKEIGPEAECEARSHALDAYAQRVDARYFHLEDNCKALSEKYKELTLLYHKEDLDDFCQEYYNLKHTAEAEVESLEKYRGKYLSALKEKQMTHKECQRLIVQLKIKQQLFRDVVTTFKADQIDQIVQQGYATAEMVEEYLKAYVPTSDSEDSE